MVNYIIVTGGVVSGLGKGITTASIGKILQLHGYKVTAIKIDPEVWVTEDGGEIDQDLGHYERFLDINIPKCHNITTGQVYGAVIEKERKGKYLGKTVQPIPHVTDEIKRRMIHLMMYVGKKSLCSVTYERRTLFQIQMSTISIEFLCSLRSNFSVKKYFTN